MKVQRTHSGLVATYDHPDEERISDTQVVLLDIGFGVVESARMAFARFGVDPGRNLVLWDWLTDRRPVRTGNERDLP